MSWRYFTSLLPLLLQPRIDVYGCGLSYHRIVPRVRGTGAISRC